MKGQVPVIEPLEFMLAIRVMELANISKSPLSVMPANVGEAVASMSCGVDKVTVPSPLSVTTT